MNSVYNFGARMAIARKWGKETASGGELDNEHLNKYVPAGSPLAQFYQSPDTVWTPRVLKDGSDSVGALGALNRVFVNIGLFSEEWLEHFRPFVGGQPGKVHAVRDRRARTRTRATGRRPKPRRRTSRCSSSRRPSPTT